MQSLLRKTKTYVVERQIWKTSLDDQKLVIVESLKSTSLSMENDLLIQYPKEMKIFQEDLIKQINKDDVLNRFNDIQT